MSYFKSGGLFVLFGASGDLAKRFILPALHQLFQRGKLSEDFAVVGSALTDYTDEEFREMTEEAVKKGPNYETFSKAFLDHVYYETVDYTDFDDFTRLEDKIESIVDKYDLKKNFLYYYSISPSLFYETTKNLRESGIAGAEGNHRVIVEKPFGHDLKSAEKYHDILLETFDEEEIYFNDHFPAMDMAQNVLATRFYNPMLDDVLNSEYVKNVQISLPETLSVGDRGGFYDDFGASLDMFQNHMLQLLTVAAMDIPENLTTESVHREKLKVLQSIPELTKEEVEEKVVRGQYQADHEGHYNDYRDEVDVPSDSNTETYFAAELEVDMERWQGVPFYVRTGKSLVEDYFAIDYVIKAPEGIQPNVPSRITFNLEPKTGLAVVLPQVKADESFSQKTTEINADEKYLNNYIPDPFENIIYDALHGEKVLFTTFDEIQEQWRIADSIMEAWDQMPEPDFPNYRGNSFGPKEADELPKQKGHEWIYRLNEDQ